MTLRIRVLERVAEKRMERMTVTLVNSVLQFRAEIAVARLMR